MTLYREFKFYSVIHDREMVRLSCADSHGREFFVMVPSASGKRWRERREEALTNIEAAIAQGCDPGEVRVMESESP